MKTFTITCAVLFSVLSLSSSAQMPGSNTLLISPGDTLHMSVLDMPDLDLRVRVTDAGTVPLPGVGEVKVVDMTPSQAAMAIHDRFIDSHFLNHPQVSIVVDQYVTQSVTLIGELRAPGAYPITTPRPILDVLALAGGLDNIADRNILIERHSNPNQPIHYKVSNDGAQALKDQILVNPGDTIVVSKAGIVYILGDVNRPGGYVMNNNESRLSLLEALTMAGGPTRAARLGHARLIRKSDKTDTQLSLGEIEKGKQPDIELAAGDILYVPFSLAKNMVITGSSGITAAASAAAVYAAP